MVCRLQGLSENKDLGIQYVMASCPIYNLTEKKYRSTSMQISINSLISIVFLVFNTLIDLSYSLNLGLRLKMEW